MKDTISMSLCVKKEPPIIEQLVPGLDHQIVFPPLKSDLMIAGENTGMF